MPQPEDKTREPEAVEQLVCEVCGIAATCEVADFIEGEAIAGDDGLFKSFSLLARHAYCPDHVRPSFTIEAIGGWGRTNVGVGGGDPPATEEEPPEGKPWPIGRVLEFDGGEYRVTGYIQEGAVTLASPASAPPDEIREMNYSIRVIEELIQADGDAV